MKKILKPTYLKKILDELSVIQADDYEKLTELVHFREFEKGETLRPAGTTEDAAYLIIEGGLGLIQNQNLVRVYFQKQVAFDVKAFKDKSSSPYSLVSLQKTTVAIVSRANETKILEEIPAFRNLSALIWEMAKKSDDEWVKISQMHYQEALLILKTKLGSNFSDLENIHLGQLVGVNVRTIIRYKKRLYTQRKSISFKARAKELFDYPFFSIIHGEVEEIDSMSTCWASEHRLLPNQKAISTYQKMKMTWLSARLYPEAKTEKAIWLANLYALLFILDDFTDKIPKGQKHSFWENFSTGIKLIVEKGAVPTEKGKIRPFWLAFADLWEEFKSLSSDHYLLIFKDTFMGYLKENIWESLNLDLGKIPSIEIYLSKRPVFSGGFLALQLIPFIMEEDYPNIHTVWKSLNKYTALASKLIYTSNDLLSFEKENKIKDPHNWVFLLVNLQNMEVDKAMDHLLIQHNLALKEFTQMDESFRENYSPSNRTLLAAIKNIKYQVSGAVAWSVFDTRRYLDF